jgi:cytoskeleton protein RodZ
VTEPDNAAAPAAPAEAAETAGGLLRRAREKQGMHIAVLAATIKVQQRKLEALEGDRYDELPDATFTRALAQTVCRTLKIDAAPVLALLPRPGGHRLEHVSEGINAPFHDRGTPATGEEWSALLRPGVVVPVLVVLAAAALYLLPAGTVVRVAPSGEPASAPQRAASASAAAPLVATPAIAPSVAPVAVPASAPASEPAPAATAADVATPPPSTLQIKVSAPSWVEVLDARGQPLISRIVEAGEVIDLDGALPLKLRIGNARATQVTFRGQAVELGRHTRDNVARFDLR